MTFSKNIQLFDLEVYNPKIKEFFVGITAFDLFLDNKFVKKKFHLNHRDMVKSNWINKNWLIFIKWYRGGPLGLIWKKDYLYRGIRDYDFSAARRIIKYGHDRRLNEEWNSDVVKVMKEKYGLDNSQWIWAKNSLSWVWTYANSNFLQGEYGTRIILIYDPDYLKYIDERDFGIYVLREGVKSFRDSLFGIIRVKFL